VPTWPVVEGCGEVAVTVLTSGNILPLHHRVLPVGAIRDTMLKNGTKYTDSVGRM
jgi:hypothetical protein